MSEVSLKPLRVQRTTELTEENVNELKRQCRSRASTITDTSEDHSVEIVPKSGLPIRSLSVEDIDYLRMDTITNTCQGCVKLLNEVQELRNEVQKLRSKSLDSHNRALIRQAVLNIENEIKIECLKMLPQNVQIKFKKDENFAPRLLRKITVDEICGFMTSNSKTQEFLDFLKLKKISEWPELKETMMFLKDRFNAKVHPITDVNGNEVTLHYTYKLVDQYVKEAEDKELIKKQLSNLSDRRNARGRPLLEEV